MKHVILRMIPGVPTPPGEIVDTSTWRPQNVTALERQGRIRLVVDLPAADAVKKEKGRAA